MTMSKDIQEVGLSATRLSLDRKTIPGPGRRLFKPRQRIRISRAMQISVGRVMAAAGKRQRQLARRDHVLMVPLGGTHANPVHTGTLFKTEP
jgi:hypothetical protein